MKKLIFITLVLLFNANVFSQNQHRFDGSMIITSYKEAEKEKIKGSPYLFEEFSDGKVFFKDQKEPATYMFNYNAYTNSIEFVKDGNTYQVSNTQNIDSIVINNNVMLKTIYTEDNADHDDFLIRLNNNKIKLYKKVDIYYVGAREGMSGYEKDKPAEYVRKKPEFFVSVNEKPATLIKNKKSLLSLFNNDKELSSFLKKEKLNIKKEKDFIEIIHYINSKNNTLEGV